MESKAGAKDLFKMIIHSPALLTAFLVGIALIIYFLVKYGPSSTQNAGTTITPTAAGTVTAAPASSHVWNENGPRFSSPTSGPISTPVVSTPPVTATPAVASPVATGTVTPTSAAMISAFARAQGGSVSTSGIGIRNQPGGSGTQTVRNVGYGQAVQIAGPAVTGQSNNPVTKGVANTNQWYPVIGGGYVSAADVNVQ